MSDNKETISLCIICNNNVQLEQARSLANALHLPLFNEKNNYDLQLILGEERIELYDKQLNTSIFVDFAHGAQAHRQHFGGGRGQAIAKAIGLKQGKRPKVLDITAGLARDAYVLATLGCHMTLVEKSPILSELIRDGINRGLQHENSHQVLANNFALHNADAVEYMQTLPAEERPDVIYLDPMFPERKKSALVKKDMQILQRLLGKNENNDVLLDIALDCAQERVVVKRPKHAPHLTNTKPNTSILSKKTRFDIYLTN